MLNNVGSAPAAPGAGPCVADALRGDARWLKVLYAQRHAGVGEQREEAVACLCGHHVVVLCLLPSAVAACVIKLLTKLFGEVPAEKVEHGVG